MKKFFDGNKKEKDQDKKNKSNNNTSNVEYENSVLAKKHNKKSILYKLPTEILLHIFSFLRKKDLQSVSLTCEKFSLFSKDKYLMKAIQENETRLNKEDLEKVPDWLFRAPRDI